MELLIRKLFEDFSFILLIKIILRILFVIFSAHLINYIGKIWRDYRYFEKLGIKTPPKRFLLGNLFELKRNRNESSVVNKWTKELGQTYGYFEGHLPILVTSDLEIIQEVFIKQFNNFSGRKQLPLASRDSNEKLPLIRASKGRWKRQRLIINPTFSSAKLREMGPLIVKCIERLLTKLDKEKEIEINFPQYLKYFTMDTIWNCAFGLDIDLQNNPKNEYFVNSENLFRLLQRFYLPVFIATVFHEISPVLTFFIGKINDIKRKLGMNITNPYSWLNQQVDQLLEKRLDGNSQRRDYMQLLLDARTEKLNSNELDDSTDLTNITIQKSLSNEEVQANLVMFMLAGYETTSTSLAYASFILVNNLGEQQRLRDEIDQHFPVDANITPDTENIKELVYLDCFIKEVLRMYPVASFDRRCTKETEVKGMHIPVDMIIRVDHLALHYNPELWGPRDPNEFYPLRHLDKRHPLSFVGFGLGPRNCVGMKFAQLEMKLALVNILKGYEMHPSAQTPKEMATIEAIVRQPRINIPIIFKKRQF